MVEQTPDERQTEVRFLTGPPIVDRVVKIKFVLFGDDDPFERGEDKDGNIRFHPFNTLRTNQKLPSNPLAAVRH